MPARKKIQKKIEKKTWGAKKIKKKWKKIENPAWGTKKIKKKYPKKSNWGFPPAAAPRPSRLAARPRPQFDCFLIFSQFLLLFFDLFVFPRLEFLFF